MISLCRARKKVAFRRPPLISNKIKQTISHLKTLPIFRSGWGASLGQKRRCSQVSLWLPSSISCITKILKKNCTPPLTSFQQAAAEAIFWLKIEMWWQDCPSSKASKPSWAKCCSKTTATTCSNCQWISTRASGVMFCPLWWRRAVKALRQIGDRWTTSSTLRFSKVLRPIWQTTSYLSICK